MKKIIELKVTEICQISKTFLPAFDNTITTILLVIGETPVGDVVHVIIPTSEADLKTDRIFCGESFRFVCYTHEIFIRNFFEGIDFSGQLCLKVMDV